MENPLDLPTPPSEKAESTAPRPPDLTGRTLGDFQLVRRIGQGGMGQVYLARQVSLKRNVAVKILRTDLAANLTALQRFKHEAEAVARITHPNIVQVYAIGESEGLHYMVLEYVEGRNLRDFINRKGPLDVPNAINIMRQVASALHRASELGFVHRDIKPENILLTRKWEVKVADFGLTRCFATDQPLNLTQSGVSMGTPLYMSPEQVQGHPVDPRSDIYSFGVTCYHMLSGEPPFRGLTPFEVSLQHVQTDPQPLNEVRPDLPKEICAVVHKMMAKKPEDRYQTAREVLRDLTRLKDGLPTTVSPTMLTQSGSGGIQAYRPNDPTNSMSAMTPVSSTGSRWRHWVLGIVLIACAGSFGAALHWKSSSNVEQRSTEQVHSNGDLYQNPAKSQEKELLKRLSDSRIKSDLEVINALLDLSTIYIRENRFDEALQMFESEGLRKRPAVAEAFKSYAESQKQPPTYPQYCALISTLGKGIVLAQKDDADKSNQELKNVLGAAAAPPKGKPNRQVDSFLWRYDHWKRAIADSLERNAKNLGIAKLDDPLNRYRSYSSKMP